MKNTKLKKNEYLDVPTHIPCPELSSIAKQVKECEDSTGLSIYFKKQRAFANVDSSPVKLIKASSLMSDLPDKACICWLASGQANWRFTKDNWHYIHFHTWKYSAQHSTNSTTHLGDIDTLCVQGDYMPQGPGAMRKTDYIMQVTAEVFKQVYNLEVTL